MADEAPKRLQDRYISSLKPFSDKGLFKQDENRNPLTSDLVGFLNFYDHLADVTLGDMAKKYLYDQGMYRDAATGAEKPIPEAKLEEFCEAVIAELEAHPKYRTAFTIAKYTSHFSQAIGGILIAGAGRMTMKKLDEMDEKPYKGIRIDPIDKFQLFDFALKGAACTAYQLVRSAPEHHYEKTESGVLHLKHLATDALEDARTAIKEPFHNRYNRQFWLGYLIFDGLINLPGHFLASGKPLSEMKEAEHILQEGVEEHAHEFMDDLVSHIPHFSKHKDAEGLVGLVNSIVPQDKEAQRNLASLAQSGVKNAVELLDPKLADRIVQVVKDSNNPLAAQYVKRRERTAKVLEQARSGGGRSAASIMFGGLLEGATAGIDMMGIYKAMARKDITFDAMHLCFNKIKWTDYGTAETNA